LKKGSQSFGKIFKMTEIEKFITLVDNDLIKPSDAIILLEGDGLNRIDKAVELFKNNYANVIVFSGEINNPGYGSYTAEKVLPVILNKGVPDKNIIHENKSTNTREQAAEVIKLSIKNSWKRIILVASHYHQYRAYLTFLKVLQEQNINLIIYNAPTHELKWFEETGWGKRINLLEYEFKKINEYSELNHIASYQTAIEYQRWKEEQI